MDTSVVGVTHRFVELPGLRMHIAEAGHGEPVILAHGFPQNWWAWHQVIPALAENFHVIAPDLRGTGQTDAPRNGYDRRSLTEDILNLANVMGFEKFNYVGHDWSGILGQQLCLENPARVAKLVVLAIPPLGMKPSLKLIPPMLKHGWFEFLMPIPYLTPKLLGSGKQPLARYLLSMSPYDKSAFTADDIEQYISPLREPARAKAGRTLYNKYIVPEGMGIMKGTYRHQKLTPHSLFIMGEQDDIMPPDAIGGYENYLQNGTLQFIDQAGHFLVDHQPELVTQLIREVLTAPAPAQY